MAALNIWPKIVTRISLIAYFKVLRTDGFEYSLCWNLPMVQSPVQNFHMFYTNHLPFRESTVEEAGS